jgi:hypothetical protein
MSFIRPTSLAAAFVTAAANAVNTGKVDHSQSSWVARRVIHNASERGESFGMVREFDKRPNPVQVNAGIRVLNT